MNVARSGLTYIAERVSVSPNLDDLDYRPLPSFNMDATHKRQRVVLSALRFNEDG